MLINEINLETLKKALFEVYSAGFEAGYSQETDIVKSYNKYWNDLLKIITERF